ncbi:MAG TPA: VCBS repeat-containing protein [Pseudomonadales bacterium]|nr:VCBS repeat-containing protein [Pseudomonadales bacterium]
MNRSARIRRIGARAASTLVLALPLLGACATAAVDEDRDPVRHLDGSYSPMRVGSDQSLLKPTTVALADVDGDGFLDLIVGNGGDRAMVTQQPLLVLRNRTGDGSASSPDAVAYPPFDLADQLPFGQAAPYQDVCVGDIDADGCPDLVAARFADSPTDMTMHEVWMNAPAPRASAAAAGGARCVGYAEQRAYRLTSPIAAARSAAGFGCALGDADGDGDLDLAIAYAYTNEENPPRTPTDKGNGSLAVYLNDDGALRLESGPWVPADIKNARHAGDVIFADVDLDGRMDLVASVQGARVYFGEARGDGSALADSAGWSTPPVATSERPEYSMGVDVGWLADRSTLGIAISMNENGYWNRQRGRDRVMQPCASQLAATCHGWTGGVGGEGADILIADIDAGADLVSTWYSAVEKSATGVEASTGIYWGIEAAGGPRPQELQSLADDSIVGQGLALAKLDRVGEERTFEADLRPDASVITILEDDEQPFIHGVRSVTTADGEELPFTSVSGQAWVSIPRSADRTEALRVTVTYLASDFPDIVIADGNGYVQFFRNLPRH